jgi:hypothetical protein
MQEKVPKMGHVISGFVKIFSRKINGFLYVLVLRIPSFGVFEGFSKGVFEKNGAKQKRFLPVFKGSQTFGKQPALIGTDFLFTQMS